MSVDLPTDFERVQPWTPAPPIESVWTATGRGLVSAELLDALPRPYGTHWLEGKAMYRPGWLVVATWHPPHWGHWTWTRVDVAPEPGVLELPRPILDALRRYAMDWPPSAHPLHWHPRVGVPVIARIQYVSCLLDNWRHDRARYPDEDDWTVPQMARAGLVAPARTPWWRPPGWRRSGPRYGPNMENPPFPPHGRRNHKHK